MKNSNYSLSAFDFVLVRIPSLPYSGVDSFVANDSTAGLMKEYFQIPESNLAIYIAAPVLHQEAVKFFSSSTPITIDHKIIKSLLKYFLRMTTRCTPFGLFAGVFVGKLGDETNIFPEAYMDCCCNVRLDTHLSCAIAEKIETLPFIQKYLSYSQNSSLYQVDKCFRYAESVNKIKHKIYKLVEVEADKFVRKIIKKSEGGQTLYFLSNELVKLGIDKSNADTFIAELIDNQILVSEFEPMLTKKEILTNLLDSLSRIFLVADQKDKDNISLLISRLNVVQGLLDDISKTPVNSLTVNDFKSVVAEVEKMDLAYSGQDFLQIDLNRDSRTAVIKKTLAADIAEAVEVFSRFYVDLREDLLKKYKNAFIERFDTAEIPLTIALDPQVGISFPYETNNQASSNQFFDDINFPTKQAGTDNITWSNEIHTFWYEKIHHANKAGIKEIVLEAADFQNFPPNLEKLTATISVMVNYLDKTNDLVCLKSIAGTSALNMQARFAFYNDELSQNLNRIAEAESEAYDGHILAEIVHLPQSRLGNVTLRPRFHKYEIPYLAKSSADLNHQIPIADLMLSVKNNQLVLRSRKFNKVVIPRLSNAHNFTSIGLPIYQFLSCMQNQGQIDALNLDLGIIAGLEDFIPRIQYKNVIFSSAIWNLKRKDYRHLLELKGKELLKEFTLFREAKNVPQLFNYSDKDNEVLIDSMNILSLDFFMDKLRKTNLVKVSEVLFNRENAPVQGSNASYANQIIFSYRNLKFSRPDITLSKHKQRGNENKENGDWKFPPGSKWLYFKIYTGFASADKILTTEIRFLVNKMLKDNIISKWFFIRFADPEFHIRLRFELHDVLKTGLVIQLVNNSLSSLLNSEIIFSITVDTYKREMNRYGNDLIAEAESIFYNDSLMSLEIIRFSLLTGGEELRWFSAIKSVDSFFDLFKLEQYSRHEICKTSASQFAEELNMPKQLKKELDKKYLDLKNKIELILTGKEYSKEEKKVIDFISNRNMKIAPIITMFIERKPKSFISGFITSIIHMNINRLLKARNRENEYIIYYMLEKYYRYKISKELNFPGTM